MEDVPAVQGFAEDPITAQTCEELKKLDNRPVATRYTPDGEVVIRRVDGRDQDEPLDFPDPVLPLGLRPSDKGAMAILHSAVCQVRDMPKRNVPVTRGELERRKVTKTSLTRLERLGLVQTRLVRLIDATGKAKRAVAVCYPTSQGRAFVLKNFDPEYERDLRAYEAKKRAGAGKARASELPS
jgi:hypothetical protein